MKQKKTLQDLSLIDNFLFGAMMTDPDVGIPFSRKLIKLILGKEIADIQITPQKVFYGVDTDMHGARLDVYLACFFDFIPMPTCFHTTKRGRKDLISQIPATSFFIFSFMCLRPIHTYSQ